LGLAQLTPFDRDERRNGGSRRWLRWKDGRSLRVRRGKGDPTRRTVAWPVWPIVLIGTYRTRC